MYSSKKKGKEKKVLLTKAAEIKYNKIKYCLNISGALSERERASEQ